MFSWFRRFFKRHRERYVFHFWDGDKDRSADPLEVERSLILTLGDSWRESLEELSRPVHPELIGEEADEARKNKEQLRSKVLYAIDAAFDVKSFKDGEGLTEVERFGLLAGYNRFCIALVRLGRPFVTRQSRASPGPGSQPTSSGVESTSQDTE